ncbi:hypothetical protein OS965_37075 [Streptomyces sp. H27-G5]|uniref:hypothetical protein n=1 Tax=Streptomyces sp. H27-G5 TaxID=2996698 RepID=UPI00226EDF32|nr:hypothetical protein [Streptomyces sp. H27-G5]MCY0923694.1 hypothetical protein [Streptomyces sp. H27-G5]
MARNYFGGTSADVAEDEAGSRLPNLPGRVYLTATDPDPVKDVLGPNDEPLDGLLSDERGMIPQFQGPDGTEQLWVDFGKGRTMLTANNVGVRFRSHLLPNADPHGDRAYSRELLEQAVLKTGRNDCRTIPSDALFNVDAPAGTNDVIRMNRDAKTGTNLKSSGALYLDPFTDNTALVINSANVTDTKPLITVNGSTPSTFRVMKNGDIRTNGALITNSPVQAPNVGDARVFSGPADPATQGITLKPGDVWVTYGG